ncbi:MAG: Gfo/Idh/MocA family oxidoreductase [Candidatus Latescibacteria bacterium]|jgi:predicted dehydrogenase|nr:Gfo/Idh/MocA family oxidoreductase [Candidatus Latescibacterota bacterium]
MNKIKLAYIGCGGMGHRHLYGLGELNRLGICAFEPVAVCDPKEENARSLAGKIKEHFGLDPVVAANTDELGKIAGIQAVDICTDPRHHHTMAVSAFEHGWEVMVEKPMGLTARACQIVIDSAEHHGKLLAVAENYRRDPVNRLAKALIDSGAIGDPRFMVHNTTGGSDQMMISVWRHQKNASGVLIDVGVHFSDMMEFFLGDITSVFGQTRLHEPTRHNPMAGQDPDKVEGKSPGGVYERWQRDMPATFEATAEDAAYATLMFANGATAQYLEEHATHGRAFWHRAIYGSKGSLDLPPDRSGNPIVLTLSDGTVLDDENILDLVPDFELDEATAALFGGKRLWRYDLPFQETDRKIIAIEYADFADAILNGRPPEVGGQMGARSVAVSYAILESGVLNQAVAVEDVLQDRINAYQQEINTSLNI